MADKIKKEVPIPPSRKAFNAEQKQVIAFDFGSCLVDATAGAGKTTAIVERIKRLISEQIVWPSQILAVTFTNKAAEEMNERLKDLGINIELMQVSTFHSVCYKIFQEEFPKLSKDYKRFQVDSTGEKSRTCLQFVLGYQMLNFQDVFIGDAEIFIQNCKNSLLKPHQVEPEDDYEEKLKTVYAAFEKVRNERKFITFDDMIIEVYDMFMKYPAVLTTWQRRFKIVIVDEFQDTNKAQYEIMRMLSAPEYNLMVVGDGDQSIYSWRGAVPDYMLTFEEVFGGDIITVNKNYRCPDYVGIIANNLIRHNKKRLTKELVPVRGHSGKFQLNRSFDFDEEATFVVDYIKSLQDFGENKLKEIVVLYRTNAQSRAIEEVLSDQEIPYDITSGGSFYERKEIRNILNYFYAALNYDYRGDESMQKIINVPNRYLGRKFIDEVHRYMEKMKLGFEDALRDMPLERRYEKNIDSFLKIIDEIRRRKSENAGSLIKWLVEKIKYEDYLRMIQGEFHLESNRIDNVYELIKGGEKFKTIKLFLSSIEKKKSKRKKNKHQKNKIVLSTFHRAKGLEWNNVIMIGFNDLILPHHRAITQAQEEEERRLAFVGITRTKKNLLISHVEVAQAAGGIRDLEPSKFLEEMYDPRLDSIFGGILNVERKEVQ